MRTQVFGALLAAVIGASFATPTTVVARARVEHDYRWQGDRAGDWEPAEHYRNGKYRERRLARDDRIYRGRDGRYYCKRNDGTTGLVIGAIGGGLLGNAISRGDTLGTILGAGGGALLGREIDRGNVRCR